MTIDKGFILAAGLGTRLRPYTDEIPKPMVKVRDKPMLDHALDAFEKIGIQHCVINTHYKADVIHDHIKARTAPEIITSYEPELLDTGGGIKNAITYFDDDFFILSGDSVWENAPHENTLQALANAWNPSKMDILMLLQPVSSMKLTQGVGDYHLDANGRATRALDQSGAYMFTSIRINSPKIFDGTPDGKFSYLELMDKAQNQGRLYGLVHDGIWHHISTPADLKAVNKAGHAHNE